MSYPEPDSYLESLFTKWGTDKGIWSYTQYYETVMERRRPDVKRVLEIGICGLRDIPGNVVGASLFCWRDYFPNATVFGIDNDNRFIFNDQDRIHTALCDAYDQYALRRVMESWGSPQFDMIVDDAVHDPEPQLKLLRSLLPYLAPGGCYFIEEACAYKLPPEQPPELYFANGLDPDCGVKGVHACITPKPEQLVIVVK